MSRHLRGYVDLQPQWNSLGQMTGAWRYQRGTVQYGYDAAGRRVRRTAPDGTVTRYLYDGDDLLMEVDAAGNPIREYTYYPGVDQPHSVRVSATGATYYYAMDEPGHVKGLIDGANQVVNQYHYTPWGELEHVVEGVSQPLGYMAREYDAVTGLYQVRARWYDPQQGRFVSEDPIGLAGGNNPYVYAGGNPINNTDPSGLCYKGGSASVVHNGIKYDSGRCEKEEDRTLSNPPIQQAGALIGGLLGGLGHGGGNANFGAQVSLPSGYTPDERREAICNMNRALFVTNLAFDGTALFTAGAAVWAGKPILRAAGSGLFTRVVGPKVVGAIRPGPIPVAIAFGGSALDHGRSYNMKDVALTLASLTPGVGSYMAWRSMREACKGL